MYLHNSIKQYNSNHTRSTESVVAFTSEASLMVQCVRFTEMYWQKKFNIILVIVFLLVYNHLKLRIAVFSFL